MQEHVSHQIMFLESQTKKFFPVIMVGNDVRGFDTSQKKRLRPSIAELNMFLQMGLTKNQYRQP